MSGSNEQCREYLGLPHEIITQGLVVAQLPCILVLTPGMPDFWRAGYGFAVRGPMPPHPPPPNGSGSDGHRATPADFGRHHIEE